MQKPIFYMSLMLLDCIVCAGCDQALLGSAPKDRKSQLMVDPTDANTEVVVVEGIAVDAPKGYGILKRDERGDDILLEPGWPVHIVGKHVRVTGVRDKNEPSTQRVETGREDREDTFTPQMLAPGSPPLFATKIEVIGGPKRGRS